MHGRQCAAAGSVRKASGQQADLAKQIRQPSGRSRAGRQRCGQGFVDGQGRTGRCVRVAGLGQKISGRRAARAHVEQGSTGRGERERSIHEICEFWCETCMRMSSHLCVSLKSLNCIDYITTSFKDLIPDIVNLEIL